MRWMPIGLALFVCAAAHAQRGSVDFTSGATNILAAANGGRIVAFSSEMLDENNRPVPQWQVTNLIDGKHVSGTHRPKDSHGWSTNKPPAPGDPAWVIFAFKDDTTRLVNRIVIDPTTIDPPVIGRWGKDFELYASTTTPDGPWALIRTGRILNKPLRQTFDFPPVEARYLRLSITSNWGSDRFVGLGEVECYEAIADDDVLDQLIIKLDNLVRDLKRYRDSIRLNQPMFPEIAVPETANGETAPEAETADTETAAPDEEETPAEG